QEQFWAMNATVLGTQYRVIGGDGQQIVAELLPCYPVTPSPRHPVSSQSPSMRHHHGYLGATRHPWPCLLFVLPLLLAYELGVVWLGGTQPDTLRNGADAWLRWGLETFGLSQLYCAPALVATLFLVWSWLRFWDRPDDLLGVLTGMAIESL